MSVHEEGMLLPVTAPQMALMQEAVEHYQNRSEAVDGWLASRGIAPETADTYRLGGVRDAFPGHERVEGWLAIPYLGYDQDGVEQVLSIRFRCIPELVHPGLTCKECGHGKYQGMPGEHARMFNVRAIKNAGDEIHLTEGELDAVVLGQAGFDAVAMPGSTQWRRHHGRMLAGFNRIYIWADPDEAGAKFAADVLQSCRNAAIVKPRRGQRIRLAERSW